MYISKIHIQNYRSIWKVELDLSNFDVFVWRNNHWKSNFLEAIEWFYNGSGDISEIKRKWSKDEQMSVEIEFSGILDWIQKMNNEANKTALLREFEWENIVRIIRKSNEENKNERLVFYPKRWESGEWSKPVTGFDKTLNEFLPKLQFVKTETNLKDISKYGAKTEIGQMLSGVVNEVLSSEDEEYKNFVDKFNELFVWENSKVSKELAKIWGRVEWHLKKQFAECEKVHFQVRTPKFDDLLKNFDTEINDWHNTTASEKWDWMQRALMLAIIQTYADYRRENENIKNFIFLIDEAELHLHPTAQRNLKNALIELSQQGDQIIITSHSSVLIADDIDNQKCFRVEKNDKITDIQSVSHMEKQNVIYDLLWWSPADLLLPRNFLLVEWTSDKAFLDIIIQRFFSDKKQVQVIPVWWDIERTDSVFDYLWSIFSPLDKSLYQTKVIILLDKVSEIRKSSFEDFLSKYPELRKNKTSQIVELPVWSIEEYYPDAESHQIWWHNQSVKWRRTQEEVKKMDSRNKQSLAKNIWNGITMEQFSKDMPEVLRALENCWNNAY